MLPLPSCFSFSCEYWLLGRQRLLVILPVSRTGFCGAGEPMITELLQFGQLQPAASPCHSSFPAQRPSQGICRSGECCQPISSQILGEEERLADTRDQRNPLAPLSEPPEGPWLCCTSQGALASGEGHVPQQGRKQMDLYLCIFFPRQAKENLIEKMHGLKPKESRVHLVEFKF